MPSCDLVEALTYVVPTPHATRSAARQDRPEVKAERRREEASGRTILRQYDLQPRHLRRHVNQTAMAGDARPSFVY